MVAPTFLSARRWRTAAGILLLAAGCNGGAAEPSQAPRPVPVVTATVKKGDVPIILRGLGTVQALNVATICSQVVGFLQSIDFKEGAAVKKGDVLATIQPDIYQARLAQAQAQQQKDQAQLDNLNVNISRNEPLLKEGFATDLQVSDQKAKAAELQAALKADQAAVAYAQTELDFTKLRAPFDGITGERLIDVGNLIHPTDSGGIVVLTEIEPISVIVTVAASAIPAVQAAMAEGPVPVDVFDQAGTHKLDVGSLILINNQAQADTGTVQLKANMPNARRQLWPGTFVAAEVTTGVVKDALTVPTDAIQQNDSGTFVYVVDAGGKAETRPVTVSQRQKGVALIGQGLQDGDKVVVQGQYNLVPGAPVTEGKPGDASQTTTGSLGMLP